MISNAIQKDFTQSKFWIPTFRNWIYNLRKQTYKKPHRPPSVTEASFERSHHQFLLFYDQFDVYNREAHFETGQICFRKIYGNVFVRFTKTKLQKLILAGQSERRLSKPGTFERTWLETHPISPGTSSASIEVSLSPIFRFESSDSRIFLENASVEISDQFQRFCLEK